MAIGLYRGYSSYEYEKNKKFTITDIDLVKVDILNHIFTRKGERVFMPNFGTRIPDMVFEPLDQFTLDVIEEDIRAVINFDPRVELMEIRVIPSYDDNYVVVYVTVLYVELNITGNIDLNIQFENN